MPEKNKESTKKVSNDSENAERIYSGPFEKSISKKKAPSKEGSRIPDTTPEFKPVRRSKASGGDEGERFRPVRKKREQGDYSRPEGRNEFEEGSPKRKTAVRERPEDQGRRGGGRIPRTAKEGRRAQDTNKRFRTSRTEKNDSGRMGEERPEKKSFSKTGRSRPETGERGAYGYIKRADGRPNQGGRTQRRDDTNPSGYGRQKPSFEKRASRYGSPSKPMREGRFSRPSSINRAEPRESNPDGLIRLNKYIADAGVCSRRDADELISAGSIKVNGVVVTEVGTKVKPSDSVKYGNKLLSRAKLVYVLLNKPKDYITTADDPEGRKKVLDILGNDVKERVYPVGRLDRNTTGLLLLTNDGELAEKLSHPSYNTKKVYQVELDRAITKEDIDRLSEGIMLDDGPAAIDNLEILSPSSTELGLELHSGRNRIVRRIFEALGYKVVKLDRTMFAGLTKKDLPRGQWRYLTEKEVIKLKYLK